MWDALLKQPWLTKTLLIHPYFPLLPAEILHPSWAALLFVPGMWHLYLKFWAFVAMMSCIVPCPPPLHVFQGSRNNSPWAKSKMLLVL